jgi:ABC-type Fe3+-siderophore transport system permease subunit
MKFIIALISALATFAIVMLIYWLGGGEFERGIALGYTVSLAVWLSGVAVYVVYLFKEKLL